MSFYMISGNDQATTVRRKLLQLHARREGWLATVTDSGRTTCGPTMLAYMDSLSRPDAKAHVFHGEDVALALGVGEARVWALAKRVGASSYPFCMADVMAMQRELAKATLPEAS
jgi:hypothetical protein